MSERVLKGRCMCGAVTVEAVPDRHDLHACHCEMCRRWTGTALVDIGVAPDGLRVAGPVSTYVSSAWAERSWCSRCGSVLWYRVTVPGKEHYAVSAGLFDDAGGYALSREIYVDCKPAGYAFAGEHKKMTKREIEAAWAAAAAGETQ